MNLQTSWGFWLEACKDSHSDKGWQGRQYSSDRPNFCHWKVIDAETKPISPWPRQGRPEYSTGFRFSFQQFFAWPWFIIIHHVFSPRVLWFFCERTHSRRRNSRLNVGRPSVDYRSPVGRQSVASRSPVGRLSTDCRFQGAKVHMIQWICLQLDPSLIGVAFFALRWSKDPSLVGDFLCEWGRFLAAQHVIMID